MENGIITGNTKLTQADVVIVGTGASGLYCALQLPESVNIVMITKDEVENSDSYLAQGGISTLKNEEDYNSYFEDTMRAGRYKNNPQAVDVMIRNSQDIIEDLIKCGVEFDKTKEGLSYTREGAHSTFRILHHKDVTGKEIVTKLLAKVRTKKNIRIFDFTTMLDIVEKDGRCKGILVEKRNPDRQTEKSFEIITGKVVVWASGGIGGLFDSSTNFPHLTGDSIAIALDHHIELQDINYIQIHPTTLYSKKSGRRFLISESVRGEGAYLLNPKGERFVDELLPRDVVTTAICEEMRKFGTDHVYLSVTHLGGEEVKERFPNIYAKCLEEGYDLTKEKIPVTPAQHYFMGGVKVNLNSHTSMKHLYAIGETSCNGVHGANRLASNSLLESLVFAKRASVNIALSIQNRKSEQDEFAKFAEKSFAGATTELKNSALKDLAMKDSAPKDSMLTDVVLTDSILRQYGIDLHKFKNHKHREENYKQLVLDEIKRKDEEFYDKWCNHAS